MITITASTFSTHDNPAAAIAALKTVQTILSETHCSIAQSVQSLLQIIASGVFSDEAFLTYLEGILAEALEGMTPEQIESL